MKIPITQETSTEGIPVNIKRPDGTIRAVTQDGYVDQCDHDNYTEEHGEPWAICDTCGEVGSIVQDITDDGWDGERRQFTASKTIEWS